MTEPTMMDRLRDYATEYHVLTGIDHRDIDRKSYYAVRAFLDYVAQQEARRTAAAGLPHAVTFAGVEVFDLCVVLGLAERDTRSEPGLRVKTHRVRQKLVNAGLLPDAADPYAAGMPDGPPQILNPEKH